MNINQQYRVIQPFTSDADQKPETNQIVKSTASKHSYEICLCSIPVIIVNKALSIQRIWQERNACIYIEILWSLLSVGDMIVFSASLWCSSHGFFKRVS